MTQQPIPEDELIREADAQDDEPIEVYTFIAEDGEELHLEKVGRATVDDRNFIMFLEVDLDEELGVVDKAEGGLLFVEEFENYFEPVTDRQLIIDLCKLFEVELAEEPSSGPEALQ